ncbi:dTDP-4-amino-4,6-dideoxygalactose transaminase [Alteribacillus iranensis]|uniref:dTDP-4-amino-4,6-dideoxygalactose transaminase n=1 Tax=Alteribacillus iranensis TaxID=930128 RepID=A0A1I2DR06_9BACI|nr:dTDP-4-amino-4,6-dideoxygalactose transaminase [Alteribacillus iranensis]SFE82928.1 dTDP-4-amino-4,6-dideoxygalactose transaminase [Alteribacillus iranensis]
MIPFNRRPYLGTEDTYIQEALQGQSLAGDGPYTKDCQQWLEEEFHCNRAFLTPSCTHALEMTAILAGIEPGDEVIMPSYTFVSTANAFVLRGADIVFVDIRPDTLNINEKLIEDAITPKTKAIVPVHYAGVACEMDTIMEIAEKHKLFVIEDAAQGVKSTYHGKALGTIGHLGAYSFHETKNYTSGGEGGALLVNTNDLETRAEIIREKGTNRSQFFRGQIDKYTWVDVGSSYLPGELNAAYLYAQLKEADHINEDRLTSWKRYYELLEPLCEEGKISLPVVPESCSHNAHMFYIKTNSLEERTELIQWLKQKGIQSTFHYVPLHTSTAGEQFGRFHGVDKYTTENSDRLVRLPMYYGLTLKDIKYITTTIRSFYE